MKASHSLLPGLRPTECPTLQEDFEEDISSLGLGDNGADKIALFAAHNTPVLHNIILFAVLRGWLPDTAIDTSFVNEEVSGLKIITQQDISFHQFAFPMHEIMLRRFFRLVAPQ